jgi:zinc transport system ATP-binding protein
MSTTAQSGHCPACEVCCTRLENVGVSLGRRRVLSAINLHIHCGALTAVIGPNGAGKTTLLRAILGEVQCSGAVVHELSHVKHRRNRVIGYVPQRLDFDATSPVTVLDLFAASIAARPVWLGHSRPTIEAASAALALVDAQDLLRERLGALSGGQLQRVLLTLALTPMPDLLLLDEPVSGVDPAGLDLFYRMVSDLRHQYHLAILLVSHDCATVARYADRMIFLNRSILCDGPPAQVLKSEIVTKTFGSIQVGPASPPEEQPCSCPVTGAEVQP